MGGGKRRAKPDKTGDAALSRAQQAPRSRLGRHSTFAERMRLHPRADPPPKPLAMASSTQAAPRLSPIRRARRLSTRLQTLKRTYRLLRPAALGRGTGPRSARAYPRRQREATGPAESRAAGGPPDLCPHRPPPTTGRRWSWPGTRARQTGSGSSHSADTARAARMPHAGPAARAPATRGGSAETPPSALGGRCLPRRTCPELSAPHSHRMRRIPSESLYTNSHSTTRSARRDLLRRKSGGAQEGGRGRSEPRGIWNERRREQLPEHFFCLARPLAQGGLQGGGHIFTIDFGGRYRL